MSLWAYLLLALQFLNLVNSDLNNWEFKVFKITLGFREVCIETLKSLGVLNFIKKTDKPLSLFLSEESLQFLPTFSL